MILDSAKIKTDKKQTAINFLSNVIAYLISVGISFILTPFLVNVLGKDTYSFYPISTSITNTMITVTAALNTVASRFISVSIFKKDNENAKKYFSSTFFADTLFSLLLLIIMSIFIIFVNKFLDIPFNALASIRLLFVFTFASALVNIFSTVFGVATFVKNRIDLRAYRELAASILKLLLFVFFYTFLPSNIFYIGLIAFIIAVFNIAIQYIYTKKLLSGFSLSIKYISKTHFKDILLSTIWVAINSIGSLFISSSTIVIANMTYGANVSGTFSIAHTIPGFMGGIISMLCGIYYPLITKYVANNNDFLLNKIIKKSQTIIGVFVTAFVVVFSFFAPLFYALWTPSEDNSYLAILTIIYLLPFVISSFFWIITFVFTAKNKVMIPAILSLAFGTLNVLIQFILGKCGADKILLPIVSSCLSIALCGIAFPIYLRKITTIKIATLFYVPLKIIATSILVASLTFVIQINFCKSSWISFFIIGGIAGLLSIIVYIIFVEPKQILRCAILIKSKTKKYK